MGGVGPVVGQLHHFRRYAAHESYSLGRYEKEVHRLDAVLDKELGERPYLASDDYSIADIATYPWIARFPLHGLEWAAVPNVKRWFDAVGARPAVASGMAVPSRSEEHTSELQSLMRNSYAVFCLKKKKTISTLNHHI